MIGKLYLLEVLIESIHFSSKLQKISDVNNWVVELIFSDIMKISIDPKGFSKDSEPAAFNRGSSFLFSCIPEKLSKAFVNNRLDIRISDDSQLVGTAKVQFDNRFSEVASKCLKPYCVHEECKLTKFSEEIATLSVFLRFSCFGQSLQTPFSIKKIKEHGAEEKEVDNVTLATSYIKLEPRSKPEENDSFTPIFNPDIRNMMVSVSRMPMEFEESDYLTENTDNPSDISPFVPSAENDYLQLQSKVIPCVGKSSEDYLNSEKINNMLCQHKNCPAAKKFKEYGIGPLARGQCLGTVYHDIDPPVTYGLSNTYGTLDQYGPYGLFKRPKRVDQPFIPPKNALETQTPVHCKNLVRCNTTDEHCCTRKSKKGCKFIPPLRLTGGGTTSDDIIIPPSHFQNLVTSNLPIKHLEKESCVKNCSPLRLVGGGPTDDIRKSNQEQDGESSKKGPNSPFVECRDVMKTLDKILDDYKKALGPCGQTTCPYSPNVVSAQCQKVCPHNFDTTSNREEEEDSQLNQSERKSSIKPERQSQENSKRTVLIPESENKPFLNAPGCGKPSCSYSKYKTGLMDVDAEMEMEYLPPALSGNCKHPACPYPDEPHLPPIHWDCPDPLPKDVCKNPECPFLPPDLKALKILKKNGPCGNVECPYSIPDPCELPTCPFNRMPCPYSEQSEPPTKSNPTSKSESPANKQCCNCTKPSNNCSPSCPFPTFKPESRNPGPCANPVCPFAEKLQEKPVCNNTNCSCINRPKPTNNTSNPCDSNYSDESSEIGCSCSNNKKNDPPPVLHICDNPQCPFRKNTDKNCGKPDCPFNQNKGKRKSTRNNCGRPSCPFKESDSNEMCDDPNCPFSSKKNKPATSCNLPNCPFGSEESSSDSSNYCGDPNCPFALDDSDDNEESGSTCGVPDCPFNKKRKPTNDCPFKLENTEEVCNDPNCPYSQPNVSYTAIKLLTPEEAFKPNFKALITPMDIEPIEVPKITPYYQKKFNNAVMDEEDNDDDEPEVKLTEQKKQSAQDKIKKKRGKFVYSIGDNYPGVKIGHRECNVPRFLVPAKMGWLWNIHTPCGSMKPRRGWRPGAVPKKLAAIINKHRQSKRLGNLEVPNFKSGGGGGNYHETVDPYPPVKPKPTLLIKKKDGCYFITMHPLKDPNTLTECENPYMDCTPLQFKISKKPKDDESKLCYCDDGDKSTSSSDSELDIEFTPPAGIIHPERFARKPDVAYMTTQYCENDFKPPKPPKGAKGGKGKGGKGKGGKGKGGKKGKK